MLIYRVEHRDTRTGPYHTSPGGLYKHEMGVDRRHPRHRRVPDDWTALFGFENKSQLSAWFSVDQRCRLAQNGFVLALYEAEYAVPDDDHTQVAFTWGVRLTEVNLSPTEEI